MNTHDKIELPPLPPLHIVPSVEPVDYPEVARALIDYARTAIKADRQRRNKALQAECEKLRNLLRHAQPIIKAHAEASHMLEGFRPRRNQWDELVEGIDAAIQEENRGR